MVSISNFFETVAEDPRVLPSHIVVYMGLISEWQTLGCPEEFSIVVADIVPKVKLTREMFRRRINDLKAFGYIRYAAAENQHLPGLIGFKKL